MARRARMFLVVLMFLLGLPPAAEAIVPGIDGTTGPVDPLAPPPIKGTILFESTRSGGTDLYTYALDTTKLARYPASDDTAYDGQPSWAPPSEFSSAVMCSISTVNGLPPQPSRNVARVDVGDTLTLTASFSDAPGLRVIFPGSDGPIGVDPTVLAPGSGGCLGTETLSVSVPSGAQDGKVCLATPAPAQFAL